MKKFFPMYHDYRQHLEWLSGEDVKRLLLALFDYSEHGTEPELDGAARMAFSFMSAQIERDSRKYEEKCQVARKNIQKRWDVTETTESIPTDTDVYDGIPTDTKEYQAIPTDTDDTNTKTKKKTKTNTKTNFIPPTPLPGECVCESVESVAVEIAAGAGTEPVDPSMTRMQERFANFWQKYPRKQGKGAAEKAFFKLHPTQELFDRMMAGLARAMACEQWQRDNGQFIPNPATWLNQRRWEDEPDAGFMGQPAPKSEPTYDVEAYESFDFLREMEALNAMQEGGV